MADITSEIKNFQEAVYGEDVRESMISLAKKVNNDAEDAVKKVEQYNQAESQRVTAEKQRAEAESQRAQKFSLLKSEAENATEAANAASTNANSKAAIADEAAEKANSAADNANLKTQQVQSAVDQANTATSAANNAASKAQEAVSELQGAAAAASLAANAANTAADAANNAATTADAAADRANKAAKAAEDAVSKGSISNSEKGAANGVATLDENKKLPKAQLPELTKSDVGLSQVPNVGTNDQVPNFSESSQRQNIQSGETLAILFGKIQKYFSDVEAEVFEKLEQNAESESAQSGTFLLGNLKIQWGRINNLDVPASGSIQTDVIIFPHAYEAPPFLTCIPLGNYYLAANPTNNVNLSQASFRVRAADGAAHNGRSILWLAIGY